MIALGNGGTTDRYRWTQALGDLMVIVPLPPGTKTKMLDVVFTNNKLKVIFVFFELVIYMKIIFFTGKYDYV